MTKTVDKIVGEGIEGNKIWWLKQWTTFLVKETKEAKPKDFKTVDKISGPGAEVNQPDE